MLQTTRWKPDTCQCILEYEWDDQESSETRTHKGKTIISACKAHEGETDPGKIYSKIIDENTRKNIVFGEIIENIPALVEEVTDKHGQPVKQLKSGIEYDFSFDKDRNLVVDLKGVSIAEKATVKSLTDVKFDTKVKII